MKRKRRIFSDKFKAKIAIEAIKGIKTLSELATEYKIHPNQISTWEKQLQMNAEVFFFSWLTCSSVRTHPTRTLELC